MIRKWLIVSMTTAALACSGATDDPKDSDWDLTERQEQDNDDDTSDDDTDNDTTDDDTTDDDTTDDDTDDDVIVDTCIGPPENHRATAEACDDQRAPGVDVPDDARDYASCQTDADCTDGDNGRCVGNPHDGYYCTYDECFSDSDCGPNSVCECGGGFRSDHNICVPGNCQTDADCGAGFCSPSWGSCGNYSGVVGYFCHTCQDECIDDSDCDGDSQGFGGGYCMYDSSVGTWTCSTSHCAG